MREVAQIGAALGRHFSHELISAVATVQSQQLDDALAQLVSTGLIFRRGTPPDAEYTFKHALVQDAAYSTLLRSRRQQLHARIATTLESQFPEIAAAQPQLMAQHCAEASLNEKAVGYWLKAGRRSVAGSAMTEAVAQLQRGLDQLTCLPDDSWRAQQELDLRIELGRALMATRGLAALAVGETFARARVLAEQLDRPDYLVPLLFGKAQWHAFRSEWSEVLSPVEQLEQIGETRNDGVALFIGRQLHGMVSFHFGEFVAARALFEESRRLCEPMRRALLATWLPADPYATSLAWLAVTLTYLGYVDAGHARMSEALAAARRLNHVYSLVLVLVWACWAEWAAYAPHETPRYAEEAMALSNEHGFPDWLGWGLIHSGRASSALGRSQEGLTTITRGLEFLRASGAVASTPLALVSLAEVYAKIGQPLKGLNSLNEAAQIIDTTKERYDEAEVRCLRADLLGAMGDHAAAEESYHQALLVAKHQRTRIFELRAATSLARRWRNQGKRTEARELLAPIYGWFTEGLNTPVLQEAKALLDELNG
jgi:tetratricopeptide (TPR) repeat protein